MPCSARLTFLAASAVIAAFFAALPCAAEQPAGDDILYLNLVWHQHQPFYSKDPVTGLYTRPWVRVHATKDYYDMAAMLESYPKVRVTFNLTPVLIRQLDDFVSGAKDVYWALAEKPARSLAEDDKRFILKRFFDANYANVIGRFPRYKELLDKRGGSKDEDIARALASFSEQDFRDLQVWFNLAWFDPDFLAAPPLRALVEKQRGFAESDKAVVFGKAREAISQVLPEYKKLQDRGQIEVITTPYAHPILPLIYSTSLAAVGDPAAQLPERFSYPQDAKAQLSKSVGIYQSHLGRKPNGLWPAEGAVAQDIVKMVFDAGYRWMASGEIVLAKSMGMAGFTRDSNDTVREADVLYRPYYTQDRSGSTVAIVFRDLRLSDLIGFEYSNKPGEAAAQDLLDRLERIRRSLADSGAAGPHLVTIILDGENAWESYPNDGKEFLNALYRGLSESPTVRTTTLSEYLSWFPDQRKLKDLWPGAWFSSDYGTWIGEPEETTAWNYLGKVRNSLAQYDFYKKKTTTPEKLARALDFMYLAEGSDWFWWFGSDQESGDDEYFDSAYRSLLAGVYTSLGEPVPDFLSVPIIPAKPAAQQKSFGTAFTPKIDGVPAPGEWDNAGSYAAPGGVMAKSSDVVDSLFFGFDKGNLYLRLDSRQPWASLGNDAGVEIYISHPTQENSVSLSEGKTVLGFQAGFRLDVSTADGRRVARLFRVGKYGQWEELKTGAVGACAAKTMEIALPLDFLPDLQPGDTVSVRAVVKTGGRDFTVAPLEGPAKIAVPDLGLTETILSMTDPAHDDHGPGTYTYPTDSVFARQVFDIESFGVYRTDKNLIFRFRLFGPVDNPWGSGIGLSLQTFDVYIDMDPGKGTGSRRLLEGRNAALQKGYGWEYALWAEGWSQKLLIPDASVKPVEASGSPLKVLVDSAKREVTLTLPLKFLPPNSDPSMWAYAAAVLSQDGFPSAGVRRVRDVQKDAVQWRVGGAPDDVNHTRIMDAAWPVGVSPTQEEFLGEYPAARDTAMDTLGDDDFALVPMLNH